MKWPLLSSRLKWKTLTTGVSHGRFFAATIAFANLWLHDSSCSFMDSNLNWQFPEVKLFLWLIVTSTAATSLQTEQNIAPTVLKHPLPFVLFVIFSTLWDIFITFHFFWRRRLTTGKESPHFVPNLYSNFSVKSVLKAKTCASKPFRTELWVSPDSHGNHKIKMASICWECGSLVKSLLRRLAISTSELKIHQNGWS